jgi:hypothetical protein
MVLHALHGEVCDIRSPLEKIRMFKHRFYCRTYPNSTKAWCNFCVCVDKLSKMTHFMATTTIVTAEETTRLFRDHVYKLHHGIPFKLISDRDARFTGRITLLVRHSIGHVYIFCSSNWWSKREFMFCYIQRNMQWEEAYIVYMRVFKNIVNGMFSDEKNDKLYVN